jgi:glycosyltransferase involved in cell wall biosynthesis
LTIVIVTVADLPEGTGHTARLRTFANALADLGHCVMIWNEHGMSNIPGQRVSGTLGSVPFEYVLGTTDRRYGFGATLLKLRAVRTILRRLHSAHRNRGVHLILLNSLSFYDTVPITLWARRHNVPTIQCFEDERMEIVSRERMGIARRLFGINAWVADRWCSRFADAIIVISHYLKQKYDSLTGEPSKVHIVPTIIDCDEWRAPEEPKTECPHLLYTGSLTEHDEVENVIRALALLKRRGLKFSLLTLGAQPSNLRTTQLRVLIEKCDLTDRVEVRGYVPADDVKKEVACANILLALRRDSVWAQSGQSTKISEYLASGRIVITTPVGDNAKYLRDGETALFVASAERIDEIVRVIEVALRSSDLRRKIGAAGRCVAELNFDKRIAQTRLGEIIDDLFLKQTKQHSTFPDTKPAN